VVHGGISGGKHLWYRTAGARRAPLARTREQPAFEGRAFLRYMQVEAAQSRRSPRESRRHRAHSSARAGGMSTRHPFGRGHMVIKRIGVLKAAIVQACIMGLFGLLFGLCFLFFGTLLGSMLGSAASNAGAGAGLGMLGGIGMVIFLPIMYGVTGFVAGAIGAAIYNLVAGWVGGIELEVE
jgi:hypothetical protein